MNRTRTSNLTIPTRTMYIPTAGVAVIRSSLLDESSLADLLGGQPQILLVTGADWQMYLDCDAQRKDASPNPLANRLACFANPTFSGVIYGPVLVVGRKDSGEPSDLSWQVFDLARHLF